MWLMIKKNIDISGYTTFRIGGNAKYFCRVKTEEDIKKALEFGTQNKEKILVIGEGSNIIVSDKGYNGIVIKNEFKGYKHIADTEIIVNSGERWDDFVEYTVNKELYGIENLSHIPGTVGASVVQNIGAYGSEVKDSITKAIVIDLKTLKEEEITDMGFGYRESIFNTTQKNKYFIKEVYFKLSKKRALNLGYKDLKTWFNNRTPTIKELRKAIIQIRDKKIPAPNKYPNAGSFFKNLLLNEPQYKVLINNIQKNFSTKELDRIEFYKDTLSNNDHIKIPTSYLIDICGLKGYETSFLKICETNPLIIINKGDSKSHHITGFMSYIQDTVYDKTGMKIENEPTFIDY